MYYHCYYCRFPANNKYYFHLHHLRYDAHHLHMTVCKHCFPVQLSALYSVLNYSQHPVKPAGCLPLQNYCFLYLIYCHRCFPPDLNQIHLDSRYRTSSFSPFKLFFLIKNKILYYLIYSLFDYRYSLTASCVDFVFYLLKNCENLPIVCGLPFSATICRKKESQFATPTFLIKLALAAIIIIITYGFCLTFLILFSISTHVYTC